MASHAPRPSNCSPMVQTRYHQLIKAVEHVTDLEFEVVEAEILPEVLALIEAAREEGRAERGAIEFVWSDSDKAEGAK